MNPEQEKRLLDVQLGQATLTQVVVSHTKTVDKLLTKYGDTIYGTDAAPGLTTRMDREEQQTKRTKRAFWIVVSALTGIGAKLSYDVLAYLF